MDKHDYVEPACPFDFSMWRKTSPGPEPEEKMDIRPVLARYDDCMAHGKTTRAGAILEAALEQARNCGDRKAELTILSELMGYYRQAGAPERGISAVEAGFALLGELGLSGTVTAGTVLINGATALSAYGQPEKALNYYREAFRCYSSTLPPEDLRFAALMNNMAAAYAAAGQQDQAIRYYHGALKVLEKYPDNPDAAVTHINLAQLYAQTDHAAAQEELNQALQSLDSPAIIWNTYYAYTCRKCASAFAQFGMQDAVQEMKERAKIVHEHAGN